MSTAIMHQSALYDFGDLHIKVRATAASVAEVLTVNQSISSVQTMGGVGAVAAGTGGWAEHHPALSRATSLPAHRALGALLDRLGQHQHQHRRLERTLSEPAAPPPAPPTLPATPPHTSRYKTELCRPYEEAGVCKYGDKCQFAHGYRELRNLQRHPKYKTELCRTFHSVGFCPYGPRCHFVHNAEEARRRDPPSPGGSVASLSSASSAYASYDGSRSPHSPDSPRSPPALSPPAPAFAFRRPRSPPSPPPPTAPDAATDHDSGDEARLPVFNRLAAFGDLIIA